MVTNEQVSAQPQSLHCPVCGQVLSFRIARGRKSGKPLPDGDVPPGRPALPGFYRRPGLFSKVTGASRTRASTGCWGSALKVRSYTCISSDKEMIELSNDEQGENDKETL